ncbi:MarR family transcriptional regulator [Ramlibacter sp. AW1]|uniref:MarR family transcriptional regulator n=1 Tax=Ramlibacter aurantiacus TaxID=2801330 RepID=A0A936ZFA3_9BURK|nr:MarR family transcriptional regulator [Ramlibacter aurantiacus]MBL0419218.1 MarR family transcriptional regulator [Ramlibacter aurantiacus]
MKPKAAPSAPRKPAVKAAAAGTDADFDLNHFLPHKLSVLSRLTQDLLAATLGRSGMTVAQWRVYVCLSAQGPCHLNGIAEFTRLPQSSLSRSIAQMAERGLVQNARDENDRRIARIELTEQGRAHLARLTAEIQASCDSVFAMDDEKASRLFHRTIDELVARLNERVHGAS